MDTTLIKDIAERSVWTFLQAFLGVFVVTDLGSAEGAALAGAAAVLSMLKGVVGSRVGERNAALPG